MLFTLGASVASFVPAVLTACLVTYIRDRWRAARRRARHED